MLSAISISIDETEILNSPDSLKLYFSSLSINLLGEPPLSGENPNLVSSSIISGTVSSFGLFVVHLFSSFC